jgi:hypothetical protein
VNQSYVKGMPEAERWATIGLNKPNEMGTLFIALAGLMNLVVILDAMYFKPKGPGEAPPEEIDRGERRASDVGGVEVEGAGVGNGAGGNGANGGGR